MFMHAFGTEVATGRKLVGNQHLQIEVADQVLDRVIVPAGDSLAIPVQGVIQTLLVTASRNGVPDAEATILADGKEIANLILGPFAWYQNGHLKAASLDDGKPVQALTIRNDNGEEPCQVEYIVGFDPVTAKVAVEAEDTE